MSADLELDEVSSALPAMTISEQCAAECLVEYLSASVTGDGEVEHSPYYWLGRLHSAMDFLLRDSGHPMQGPHICERPWSGSCVCRRQIAELVS